MKMRGAAGVVAELLPAQGDAEGALRVPPGDSGDDGDGSTTTTIATAEGELVRGSATCHRRRSQS